MVFSTSIPKVQRNAHLVDLEKNVMLKNEYLLAKIGVDTAENGPNSAKVDV